jgi:proline racemase
VDGRVVGVRFHNVPSFVAARHEFVLDPDDALRHGFILR